MWRLSEAFEQRSLPQSWHEKSFLGEFPANWWIGGFGFGMIGIWYWLVLVVLEPLILTTGKMTDIVYIVCTSYTRRALVTIRWTILTLGGFFWAVTRGV